jgi:hypothetical protein
MNKTSQANPGHVQAHQGVRAAIMRIFQLAADQKLN